MNKNIAASATEANQDFSGVTRIAEQNGPIFPNASIDPETAPLPELTEDEKIDVAAARILKRFKPAFEELAK